MKKDNKLVAFEDYGRDYVEYVIERDGVEEWRPLFGNLYGSLPEFRQALANANYPVFDPAAELGIADDDGEGYEAAVVAAWQAFVKEVE